MSLFPSLKLRSHSPWARVFLRDFFFCLNSQSGVRRSWRKGEIVGYSYWNNLSLHGACLSPIDYYYITCTVLSVFSPSLTGRLSTPDESLVFLTIRRYTQTSPFTQQCCACLEGIEIQNKMAFYCCPSLSCFFVAELACVYLLLLLILILGMEAERSYVSSVASTWENDCLVEKYTVVFLTMRGVYGIRICVQRQLKGVPEWNPDGRR